MGASLYWLITDRRKSLDCWSPSSFIAALTRAFGDPPWTLDEEQLPVVRGMAATTNDPHSGFDELIRLLEDHKEIKLWPEW